MEGGLNELALFAGAGGGILGGKLLGWRTVCAVEIEEYPRSILIARQNDGSLDPFPIWEDVCTFDGRPWRGRVDVVSGGFPCQDISAAGKGAGIDGERSGLWGEMARIIGEVRPRFAFVENSPLLVGRGLAVVIGDLAEMGYDARWCVLGADDCGGPHMRKRIWILADAEGFDGYVNETRDCGKMSRQRIWREQLRGPVDESTFGTKHTIKEPLHASFICRGVDGMAERVGRIKAAGNGQVPIVAATAWRILTEDLNGN